MWVGLDGPMGESKSFEVKLFERYAVSNIAELAKFGMTVIQMSPLPQPKQFRFDSSNSNVNTP